MTTLAQNKSPESAKGFFDNITKGLTDLMSQITGKINDILVKLGLKKDKEIADATDKTQKELGDLLSEINSDFDNDGKLSQKEKDIINKNKDTKEYYDWLKNEFGQEVAEREGHIFLSKFKKSAEDDKLTEEEEKELKEYLSNQKDKIDKDENLKKIIKAFPDIKNPKKSSSIEEIITAYQEIKGEDEEKNPTIEEVLAKLEESE